MFSRSDQRRLPRGLLPAGSLVRTPDCGAADSSDIIRTPHCMWGGMGGTHRSHLEICIVQIHGFGLNILSESPVRFLHRLNGSVERNV